MWSYLTSPVGGLVTCVISITTILSFVVVVAALFAIAWFGTGRIRHENAAMIIACTFLIVGTLSWVALLPLVGAVLTSVPNEWVQAFSISLTVFCTLALVGAYIMFTTYDTRIGLHLKHKAGLVGEMKVRKVLEKAGFKAVHGMYAPYGKGARQLDHVALVGRCLIVLETKNWQGHLFGKADEPTWTQKLDGKSSNVENPLRQLDGQVRALKALVGDGVRGLVVFGDRCEMPGDMPPGAVHLCELARNLEMLKLAAPSNGADASRAWDKVIQIASDKEMQSQLKVKHDAWTIARPRNPGHEALPYARSCKACGDSNALLLNEPSRPGYSWYWRCGCRANTSVEPERGWRFERQGTGFVCKADDGRVVMVQA